MGRGAYSYRDDPAVPSFPDDRPLVLFDGDCASVCPIACYGSALKYWRDLWRWLFDDL